MWKYRLIPITLQVPPAIVLSEHLRNIASVNASVLLSPATGQGSVITTVYAGL